MYLICMCVCVCVCVFDSQSPRSGMQGDEVGVGVRGGGQGQGQHAENMYSHHLKHMAKLADKKLANSMIHYSNIPKYIDGGLLSSNTFLPFKHWCETKILEYTDKAGGLLDEMKFITQQLGIYKERRLRSNSDLYVSTQIYNFFLFFIFFILLICVCIVMCVCVCV